MHTLLLLKSVSRSTMLHYMATTLADNELSPVTIITVMPALLHPSTALGASYLIISEKPVIAINVKFVFSTS